MKSYKVAVVKYEKPIESVRKAVELSGGLDAMPAGARVFIKPNIVFWTRAVAFPKWGVITTSRIVEDIIILLKERGIADITIGHGEVWLIRNLLPLLSIETIQSMFNATYWQIANIKYGKTYKHI